MSNQARRLAATRADVAAVSVVLLLAGMVLAPAVARFGGASDTQLCRWNLQLLGSALGYYTSEHEGWFPGVNTTGVSVETQRLVWGGDPSLLHHADLPVQTWDWLLPLAQYLIELPDNRAARWYAAWTQFGCAAQREPSLIYNGGGLPDGADFYEYDWPAVSYCMPAAFSLWGQAQSGTVLGTYAGTTLPLRARIGFASWEVIVPDFASQLEQVGPADRKFFLTDATRYVDNGGLIDHDVHPFTNLFGAFTDIGGWWSGSTALGVKLGTPNWDGDTVSYGSPSQGLNLPISYRHRLLTPGGGSEAWTTPNFGFAGGAIAAEQSRGGVPGSAQANRGAMNALCFDGHVELFGDRGTRDIDHWYPSGAVVQNPDEGMTTLPVGYVVP